MNNSYICELTSTSGKYKVDNTLILPIKRSSGKIAGVIEVVLIKAQKIKLIR